ncbi:MAG: type II toxin-antitoxin system RelE/ParE family toxin [Cyanobacteria bacterium J06629_19]
MKITFRKSFTKDLRKLKDAALLKKIKQAIELAEAATSLSDIRNIKKLKGGDNHYRIRIGDYRIGLQLENDVLDFSRCLHRKEIYKVFPD